MTHTKDLLEIVRAFADRGPKYSGIWRPRCLYCLRLDWLDHADNCWWLRARDLIARIDSEEAQTHKPEISGNTIIDGSWRAV